MERLNLVREVNEVMQVKGGRMTSQRRVILDALESLGGHPTAEDILAAARVSDPTLNLSTVYRTLRWLEKFDLVRTHHFHEGKHLDRFDTGASESHYHFRCKQCNQIVEFTDLRLDLLVQAFEADHGVRVSDVTLVLSGTCADCLEKEE